MAATPDAQTEADAHPSDTIGWTAHAKALRPPRNRHGAGPRRDLPLLGQLVDRTGRGRRRWQRQRRQRRQRERRQRGGSAGGGSGSGSGAAGTGTGGHRQRAGSGTAGSGTAGSGTAGSTGSSGSGGAAGGATGAAGGGGNPCTTALLCDDFESYTTGQPPGGNWTRTMSSGATIAIDTAQFRSGSKSVKVTTPAGTSGSRTAYIRTAAASVFPAAQSGFYGRMMFRLESAPTASVHWTFVQGSGLIAGQTYHALYRYGGQVPSCRGARSSAAS